MLNDVIRIYCNEKDKDTVVKAIETYAKNEVMVSVHMKIVRILFKCSMFKNKKLKHDIKLLNSIGITAEIR